jgi:predicted amidohydrolase
MKVAALQLSVRENDPEATVAQAEKAIRSCTDADLVVLPEIWQTGFMSFDRYEINAQPLDGPLVKHLKVLAKEMNLMLHTGSFVEKDGGRLYNTSALISPDGEILGVYRKIHLFGFQSKETRILTPGETPVVVKTPFGNLGMATCFDLRFPELFRAMVDQGADMFLVCSAWPVRGSQHGRGSLGHDPGRGRGRGSCCDHPDRPGRNTGGPEHVSRTGRQETVPESGHAPRLIFK